MSATPTRLSADELAYVRDSAHTGDVLTAAEWSGPVVDWWEIGVPEAEARNVADAWARLRGRDVETEQQARSIAGLLADAWQAWPGGEVALDLRGINVPNAGPLMTSLARELWRRIRAGQFTGAVVLAREPQRWAVSLLLNDAGVLG